MIKKIKWGIIALLVGVVAFTSIPTSLSAKDLMDFQGNTSAASYSGAQSSFVTSYLTYQKDGIDVAAQDPSTLVIVRAYQYEHQYWNSYMGSKDWKEGDPFQRSNSLNALIIHSTASPGAGGLHYVNSWNSPSQADSAHAFADPEKGYVYQCLPWGSRAGHAGTEGNDFAIGVETCEPAGVFEYGNDSHSYIGSIPDKEAYVRAIDKMYDLQVKLFAYLCEEYNIDPLGTFTYNGKTVPTVLTHKALNDIFTPGHVDPEHMWDPGPNNGKLFPEPLHTVEQFRLDIKARMDQGVDAIIIDAPYEMQGGKHVYSDPVVPTT